MSPTMEVPQYAYNRERHQYNSKIILEHLHKYPHHSLKLLAVTDVDLYVPILKFVFGLSQINGQCALISLHRLRAKFYSETPDAQLLITRAEKTALHELGHMLGLTHCRNRRCVMYASSRIPDTDFKRSRFCATCFELVRWHLDKNRHANLF